MGSGRSIEVRPNDRRELGDRATTPSCAAPFVAMEFDQFGDVQACCANALYPLGNVRDSTLREIWEGPRAASLRAALLRGDFSYGCSVCRHRLDHAYGELPRDYYDSFPFTSVTPEWPYSLQFSLHNTCNLECVMCGADRSSKIRSRRSHLEPLPHAYGEPFFEQLAPFLAHCGAADFSGGEPFLIPEHFRVWSMLAELPQQPLCSLTTNGTVWNERVERVLDDLDMHVSVSMDGVSAATLERIRVGAHFDEVVGNLDRFARYTADRGTQLTITFSLVRQNWFELGAMLRFGEERGIPVKVQTVIEPDYGVQRLSDDDLRLVVESLEAEGVALAPTLDLNRPMWDREIARLRDELDGRAIAGPREPHMEPADPGNARHVAEQVGAVATVASRPPPPGVLAARRAAWLIATSRAELHAWADGRGTGAIELDAGGRVVTVDLDAVLPPRTTIGPLAGAATLEHVLDAIESALDGSLWVGEEYRDGGRMQHTLWFGRPVRDKVGLVVRLISVPTTNGIMVLAAADPHLMPAPTVDHTGSSVPVTLGARRTLEILAADAG